MSKTSPGQFALGIDSGIPEVNAASRRAELRLQCPPLERSLARIQRRLFLAQACAIFGLPLRGPKLLREAEASYSFSLKSSVTTPDPAGPV